MKPVNALYVFRSKRADRIKAVWWDGPGYAFLRRRSRKQSSAAEDCADPGAAEPRATACAGRRAEARIKAADERIATLTAIVKMLE